MVGSWVGGWWWWRKGGGRGGGTAGRNKMDCDTAGHKQIGSKNMFFKVGLKKDFIETSIRFFPFLVD